MSAKNILVGIAIIIGFILLCLAMLFVRTIYRIDVRDVKVTGLQDINLEGMTLRSQIGIANEGLLPVVVKQIEYDIYLEGLSRRLAAGKAEGARISAGKLARFPISTRIEWSPTSELGMSLVNPGATNVIIKGNAEIDLLLTTIDVPFETKEDIKPYLKKSAKQVVSIFLESLFK